MRHELEEAGKRIRAARQAERFAMSKARVLMNAAYAQGMSEQAIAESVGLSRMTVRKALGK